MISFSATWKSSLIRVATAVLVAAGIVRSTAQPSTFAGNSQHTSLYDTPAQHINSIRWSIQIDVGSPSSAHYGAPVITPSNTLFVPVRTSSGLKVSAYYAASSQWKYNLSTDYIFPAASWRPVYQPVIAVPASGPRLYYPGAGGTTYYITNIDSDTPSAPVHECFYTDLAIYGTNTNAFNTTVFINTPITADASGAVFFGFRINGTPPAPLNGGSSGIARLTPDGQAAYASVGVSPNNCAPALSNDGTTLYVIASGSILGLDSSSLATKYQAAILGWSDSSTASPTVGPDGDVYFGVASGSRGILMHFSGDLKTQKTFGGFGWDNTVAIVPTNMVPFYHGPSSYLLFSKYNNYYGGDGDGVNRIAILDPNAQQIDPHPGTGGRPQMREVLTAIGCVPDTGTGLTVREWCVNTGAVNPPTSSVFCPSEDGRLYRWNLAANSITETIILGHPIGDPYVPTIIGPDGSIYAINGNKLFSVSSFPNISVALCSSAPDSRTAVVGQPVTFTVVITNRDSAGPVPTGSVTFQDLAYHGSAANITNLATDVPLVDGVASVTTTALAAGNGYFGNHFITAFYSGDPNFHSCAVTIVQKIHASGTETKVDVSNPDLNNNVTLSAIVTPGNPGIGMPGGLVCFLKGASVLAQLPLTTNGIATFTTANPGDANLITACYASDTYFAGSSGPPSPPNLAASTLLPNGAFQFTFTNLSGAPFTVFGSTDIDSPATNWAPLGPASEIAPGQFQFLDTDVTNNARRFYRVRSP